jgi:hypothetical protein
MLNELEILYIDIVDWKNMCTFFISCADDTLPYNTGDLADPASLSGVGGPPPQLDKKTCVYVYHNIDDKYDALVFFSQNAKTGFVFSFICKRIYTCWPTKANLILSNYIDKIY